MIRTRSQIYSWKKSKNNSWKTTIFVLPPVVFRRLPTLYQTPFFFFLFSFYIRLFFLYHLYLQSFNVNCCFFLFLGCNGNGICATSSSCESRCNCNRFWEGKCCERRRPRRWWGDPHLETLDGLYIVLNLLGYLLVNLCMIRELYSQDSMLCHPSQLSSFFQTSLNFFLIHYIDFIKENC